MADSTEERVGQEGFVPRPLAEHMGWLMSRASHALGAALTEGLAPLGLNIRDYTVLIVAERAVVEGAARTQLALAQAARLDKSTMVVALDALEEEGLVERRPDPKDRRARIVVPTDAGRELSLARTTAGATLSPSARSPATRPQKRGDIRYSSAACLYQLDNGQWLEPDRAFATSQPRAENQGSLRGSRRSGEAGAACTPPRWATSRITSAPKKHDDAMKDHCL